ncbi:ABC transporter permease [Ornithinimicrobium faecis]|uniref:ABC transporter permease n=1 Tax=Ornithinimicrobium faecis TaxID=2934158 RepID=UPI0021194916|nr:ABC transporter permease [Ornithinimicrobium sp. HY1745]
MTGIAKLYRFFDRSALTMIALGVLVVFVAVGIFAPWISPHDPNAQDLAGRLQQPLSEGHLLGTDSLGRDVLSRLIHGSRISLIVGFSAVLLSAVIGIIVGLVSGYVGGWVDSLLMRIVDAWLAFPFLLLAIAIVAVLGRGLDNIVIALVITGWVLYARLVRGETLSLREREFVLSARGLGANPVTIMVKHILPNCLAPIMVVATLEVGVVIVTEASLSFLGLGASAAEPSWGGMLADGRAYITRAWWLATLPGLAIFVIVLAVNVLGDALRDALDPRHEKVRSEEVAV